MFLFEISKKHFQRHFSPPSPLSRNQISSRSRGRKLCLIIITVNSLNWNQSNNCIMIMISVCVCLSACVFVCLLVCLSVCLCVCLSIVDEHFNSPSISLFTFFLFAVKLKLLQKLFVGTFSGQKNFAIVSQAVKRKKHHCTKVFCEQKKTLPLI